MEDEFAGLMRCLDTPMAVITTASGGQRAGCLIGFHTQCSIEPTRHAIWVSKANHTYRVMLFATHVAVHLLTTDDHDLAELFGSLSGDQVDKFTRCETDLHHTGTPLLRRCPHRFIGRRTALMDDGSDHVCVVLEPVEVHGDGAFAPLRFSAASDIDAGHAAEERPLPGDTRA